MTFILKFSWIFVYFSYMLLHSIYVNNIQLCTLFPDFSRLEAATVICLIMVDGSRFQMQDFWTTRVH